jgi:hypothetical protein
MADPDVGSPSSFEQEGQGAQKGLVSEFWGFLSANKKWWLAPMVVVLLGLGLLVILSGTAVAPFIYTLF